MTKSYNQRFYGTAETLQRLADEIAFIGREFKLDLKNGVLVVYALPQRHKKSPKTKDKDKRNKRSESAARNS